MLYLGHKYDSYMYEKITLLEISGYKQNANTILDLLAKEDQAEMEALLAKLQYAQVSKHQPDEILYSYELLLGKIEIFTAKKRVYLKIEYIGKEYTFYDEIQEEWLEQKGLLDVLSAFDIGLSVAVFIYFISLLLPLRKIQKGLEHFGSGEHKYRLEEKRKDEYGAVIESFNAMAENVQKSFENSKELLRNVSHELKTPIAKGRFAVEMLEESVNGKRLKEIFIQMDKLTDDLLFYERLNYLDEKSAIEEKTSAQKMVLAALELLMPKDEEIAVEIIDDFVFGCNTKIFPIAIKNLIDNAIKYSADHKAHILLTDNRIVIKSAGVKLDKELEFYLKSFNREQRYKEIKGFGLGLGIVDKIVKLHGFSLKYEYNEGKNIFAIYCVK